MKVSSGGQRANRSGQTAESVIETILRQSALVYETQVLVGESIYGSKLRVDFFVKGLKDYPQGLIIESKWQGSGGTADEKLPYLLENIKLKYPAPTLIVIDGKGYRQGAWDWAKLQIGVCQNLVEVLDISSFMLWISKGVLR